MKKLLAKKASDLLNASVKVGATDIEPFKWFTGSIEIPSDRKMDEKK